MTTQDMEELMQKADESLAAADLLLTQGYTDFAASRSYYAMFYAAEAALFSQDVKFKSHRSVISCFGRVFCKTGILRSELGHHLKRAYERRLTGDYAYDTSTTQDEAEETLTWAKEFVSAVEEYLKGIEAS